MTNFFDSKQLSQKLGGRNLYLVGMMGSGKTSTGPCLAKELSYGFVDSDKVIEEVCGQSISVIFNQEGEEEFRLVESKVLNAIGQRHSLVVATGGGLVTRAENWGVLHQGIVVWLDPGQDRLFNRLASDPGDRPLFQSNDSFDRFQALLIERKKFYIEADLHLKVLDESPLQVAKKVVRELQSILSSPEDPSAPQTISP